MAKFKEIKEKYPSLNLSIIDSLSALDNTKTNKYLPLICKVLYDKKVKNLERNIHYYDETVEYFNELGVKYANLSLEEMHFHILNFQYFEREDLKSLIKFIKLMENGKIEKNDINEYKTIEDVMLQLSLSELNSIDKNLAKEVHKEYEDDIWCIVRPLTHQSSIKYGASTKWCTTSINNVETFIKYWETGVLVYFINKKTGYKFAGFNSIRQNEFGFFDAEDNRVDSMFLNVDDYLLPIIKEIMISDKSNYDLCPENLREIVLNYGRKYVEEPYPIPRPTVELSDDIPSLDEDYFLTALVEESI
jgi:hypothetical protein